MLFSVDKLNEILVKPGYISKEDFASAQKEAKEQKKDLLDVLVDKGLIKDEYLGRVLAQALDIPFIVLAREKIEPEVLKIVPELVARCRGIIAFATTDLELKLGMVDPGDLEILHNIEKTSGKKVIPYLITKKDLHNNLGRYKLDLKERLQKIINKLGSAISEEEKNKLNIDFVNLLLEYAYYNRASDVHIEPYEEKTVVRFRIDGILHQVLEFPKRLHDYFLTRIKILSRMRTDEHMAAQDGKFQFKLPEETVDVRVSVVPIAQGENIVMRLLSARQKQLNLSNLGLSRFNLSRIKKAIKNPHGMVLVVGPTGSGKTTTLYEILKKLNTREVHIATIEDPVEYDIEGVSQIQVNTKTNLSFSEGLRAIVRQDPDIIMVGEIRDTETARIAVNSALTGHLVLSTLHANNSAAALPRLLDMGVEPFLIASTINVIISQRLVRKICEKCRFSYQISPQEVSLIKQDKNIQNILKKEEVKNIKSITLYKGSGCEACANTGYSGRIGIFEVLELDPKIKELIVNKASSEQIKKEAEKKGFVTILEDGFDKIFTGITTLSEVLRVTKL